MGRLVQADRKATKSNSYNSGMQKSLSEHTTCQTWMGNSSGWVTAAEDQNNKSNKYRIN